MNEADGALERIRRLEIRGGIIAEIKKVLEAGGIKFESVEIALLQRSVADAIGELGSGNSGEIKKKTEEIFFEKLECIRKKSMDECFSDEDERKLAENIYRRLIDGLEKSALKITTRDIIILGDIVRSVVKEAGKIINGFNRTQWESECLARFQNSLMAEIGMEGGRSVYMTDGDKKYHEKEEVLFELVNEHRKKQYML